MLFLCDLCHDALTPHTTAAWEGEASAVCDECLMPPPRDQAWDTLWPPAVLAQIRASPDSPYYRMLRGLPDEMRGRAMAE